MNALSHSSIIIIAIIGAAMCIVYLGFLYRVIQKSAAERFDPPSDQDDNYNSSLFGAIIALCISIALTVGYGITPMFLYFGPGLCLLIPLALIYCMNEELKS